MSEPTQISFSTIDEAVKALSEGGLVVVMDDEDRENEDTPRPPSTYASSPASTHLSV